ncbi:unnamed protein product, partial [Discosporangium mesarthrocarpum]
IDRAESKEKDQRRALDGLRLSMGENARRAERELRGLRAEVLTARNEATALRARLVCVQGRRAAEKDAARVRVQELENFVDIECRASTRVSPRATKGPQRLSLAAQSPTNMAQSPFKDRRQGGTATRPRGAGREAAGAGSDPPSGGSLSKRGQGQPPSLLFQARQRLSARGHGAGA